MNREHVMAACRAIHKLSVLMDHWLHFKCRMLMRQIFPKNRRLDTVYLWILYMVYRLTLRLLAFEDWSQLGGQ